MVVSSEKPNQTKKAKPTSNSSKKRQVLQQFSSTKKAFIEKKLPVPYMAAGKRTSHEFQFQHERFRLVIRKHTLVAIPVSSGIDCLRLSHIFSSALVSQHSNSVKQQLQRIAIESVNIPVSVIIPQLQSKAIHKFSRTNSGLCQRSLDLCRRSLL